MTERISFEVMTRPGKFYWLAQMIGWSSYCGLLTLSVYTNNPDQLSSVFFLNLGALLVSGVLMTHLQRLFFIRAGWLNLKLPPLLPRLIASSLIVSIFIAVIDFGTDYLSNLNNKQDQEIDISNLIVNVFAVLVLVLFWNAIYFTFHFFQKSRNQEISNLELAASNRESELKNLRSQLNPHFLFNSLNSIRALIDIDPKLAKQAVTTLSSLMRESLLLGKENLVPLSSELKIAKSYLDLEKIRFEERLTVNWEIDESLEYFEIPPFSLQMMIENAIKHGISNLKHGGEVKVRAYRENNAVCIEVINTGDLKSVTDLGVGVENVKKRLALQFGDAASFHLKEQNQKVHAKMIFNYEGV